MSQAVASPLPDPLARFRLDGRTALVTGARREIGRAIALGLAALGARVGVHHAGSAEEASDAAGVVAEMHGRGQAFAADFSRPDAGTQLASAVTAAFGQVDILVLNASIEILEPVGGISREAYDRQVAVNLTATLDLLQALVPAMADRGWGRVVTIGSIQQIRPHPQMMVYAGSKAMQANWVVNLARQYGAQGVRANNLAPGVIATARNREQLARSGADLLARISAGRIGRPDDLVGAAMLLCSDAADYINGIDLFVDGGRHLT
jgi:NAD(P)-dependent dehydrogenase (short-subunit alcohol dehydrogenase family)